MPVSGLRILVVDDEPPIRRFLRTSLTAHGHHVLEAASAREAVRAVTDHRPDLVILDLGLPDGNGLDVVRELRGWTSIPILILSVRDQEGDKIAALDAGADDYLTKPFGVGELMARMRVALRRSAGSAESPLIEAGNLSIDLATRSVKLAGREVSLTPIEYDLLTALARNAGKVLTHHQLLNTVWGGAYQDEAHLLRVHISHLRGKLEPEPARPIYILTEPGVGYRLQTPEAED